jgi:hypothetical protein
VQSIPLSLISASKFTGTLQPTRVAIFNGSTQINDWVFNNYKFKVNSTAITNVDSFVPVVNRLNTASIKSFKLIQEIQVVTALPASPDPTVTYLVGAQDSINITGLNGNIDGVYQIDGVVISPNNQDNMTMRINNIATAVYDYRYSYAGSTSTTASATQAQILFPPNSGAFSNSTFSLSFNAVTGINRSGFGQHNPGGANQQTVGSQAIFGFNWRDNSTNITSIKFKYFTFSANYGVGTIIRVYTLRP